MLRHVTKRKRRLESLDAASSSSGSSEAEDGDEEQFLGFGSGAEGFDASEDGSDAEAQVSEDGSSGSEQDPLEKPIVDQAGVLHCVLCPAKRLKSNGDALTHTQSQAHYRRKQRIVDFLKTEEAKPFLETDDILGIVALLDERQKWVPPAERPPKKKKPRSRPGKRQRAEIREQKIAEANAKVNGMHASGAANGADHGSDSS